MQNVGLAVVGVGLAGSVQAEQSHEGKFIAWANSIKKTSMGSIKTFDDLIFKPHELMPERFTHAEMTLDDGARVSVVKHLHSSVYDDPYEIYVVGPGDLVGGPTSGLTPEGINEILMTVQNEANPPKMCFKCEYCTMGRDINKCRFFEIKE